MSARALLQAAIVAQLRGAADLAGVAIFDAPPVRAAVPHLQVDEPVLTDRSGAALDGRDGRVTLWLRDGGERPLRLRGLVDAAEAAMRSLPADLGEGWRLAALSLARSRLARGGDRWVATSEFQLRMYRPAA
jgi:hypothetical protein